MKAKELLTRLEPALKAVHPRSAIPIMQCIRFGGGQAIGSDGDMWATVNLPEYDLPVTCVPADRLAKVLGTTMPADCDVTIAVDGDRVTIKGGGRRATIATLPGDEHPGAVEIDGILAEASGSDLPAAIATAAAARSDEEARYYLNGVAWRGEWCVATSGHILIRRRAPACAIPEDSAPLLPPALLPLIPRDCRIAIGERCCVVEGDGVMITSRLIDGKLPDVDRVIPDGDKTPWLRIQSTALAATAKAVGWGDGTMSRTIVLEEANGAVRISARSGSEMELIDEIEAEHIEPGMRIGYNARYVETVLAPFDGVVEFVGDGAAAPALVRQEGIDTEAVIMPLRKF